MGRPTVLNSRELDLALQAYEAAWGKIVRREPERNITEDDERKELLRKRQFAMAHRRRDRTAAVVTVLVAAGSRTRRDQ